MEIRLAEAAERAACEALTPLAGQAEKLWVGEHEGEIVACAGYAAGPKLTAVAVAEKWRRQGVGRLMVMYVLRELSRAGNVERVWVEADEDEDAAGFFEKQGFRRQGAVLVKRLVVCS
jgi:N-acetylglutamate synthase-like GNAT family acetyltransferase